MKIQVNAGENIKGDEILSQRVGAEMMERLSRFREQITRIEVHLSDVNAAKGGGHDKRCVVEVRLEGRKPEAASNTAPTVEAAYTGAARKLIRLLESSLGRLEDRKDARSRRETTYMMTDKAVD